MTAQDFKTYLAEVAAGNSLTTEDAEAAFDLIMSGEVTPSQLGGFLMALRVRGESLSELTGAARAMRSKMTRISAPSGAIDTCGTGGDGKGTLNISTASAFVIAACGLPVAKHGNRALSSKAGAADTLSALGVVTDLAPAKMEAVLSEVGTCFLMAPVYHSAMRHVGPTRVELGTRTIFNLLGPLCNPATVKRQVLGVFDPSWVEPLAQVLKELGHDKAWVCHGDSGLDEISITGPTQVAQLADGEITRFEVSPEDAGLGRAPLSEIIGGDGAENAARLRALLEGRETGAYLDSVLLASAAGLIVGGKVDNLVQGAEMARAAVESGAAKAVLDALVSATRNAADQDT